MAVCKTSGSRNCVTADTLNEIHVFVSVFRLHNGSITEGPTEGNRITLTLSPLRLYVSRNYLPLSPLKHVSVEIARTACITEAKRKDNGSETEAKST